MSDGHVARLEQLYRQEYARLSRYVHRILGSADETVEIVNEAFLRLLEVAGKRGDAAFEPALLFRLARNLAVDLLRRRQVSEAYQRSPVAFKVLTMPSTPEDLMLRREESALVENALGQLNAKQRECLHLRATGLSYSEIAAIVGMNVQSVGPTLVRAHVVRIPDQMRLPGLHGFRRRGACTCNEKHREE